MAECIDQQCQCTVGMESGDAEPLELPYIPDYDAAMQTANMISGLEVRGRIYEMYRSMHPDAQAVIPAEAVIGWYTNEYLHFDEPAPRAVKLRFTPWTWTVTGKTYPDTAEVATKQILDDGTVVWDAVRLVKNFEGSWCWFFGRDRQFVVEQIARFVPDAAEDSTFGQWGAGLGEACVATIDCGQYRGPAQCIEAVRDGVQQMVCLHGANGDCHADSDCHQVEGTTKCVDVDRRGKRRRACLRAEGASCNSTRDCMDALTCASGYCA